MTATSLTKFQFNGGGDKLEEKKEYLLQDEGAGRHRGKKRAKRSQKKTKNLTQRDYRERHSWETAEISGYDRQGEQWIKASICVRVANSRRGMHTAINIPSYISV